MPGPVGQTVALFRTGSSSPAGGYGAGCHQHTSGAAPRTVTLGSPRPSGPPLRSLSRSPAKACLRIVGPQPEHEAHYYCSVFHNSIYGGTVFQVREKQTETCPFPVIAGDGL